MAEPRELTLTRFIDVPREKLYRCWTEDDLLKQWFVPAPWTIASAKVDVRPGGISHIVMADPEGNEYPNQGIYLEVVPNDGRLPWWRNGHHSPQHRPVRQQ